MTRNLREIGLSATTPSGDEPSRVQRTVVWLIFGTELLIVPLFVFST